mmetsp:Transcript_116021/g.370150  ORF Transcript_116021/g.370150 Transcript_116021/m.370150 type:complete len:371 (+) Transcript_116021:64-1176(+)
MGVPCCKEGAGGIAVERLEQQPGFQSTAYEDLNPAEGPADPAKEIVSLPPLSISIMGARDLRPLGWQPGEVMGGCYCEVKANDQVIFSSPKNDNGVEPVWRATFDVTSVEVGTPLEFAVYGQDFLGSDCLGRAHLGAEDYAASGFNGELRLEDAKGDSARKQASLRVKVKLPDKPMPPGPSPTFSVSFQRMSEEKPWGFMFDVRDDIQLQVLQISGGIVGEYNKTAEKPRQVEPDDYVLEVNNVSGSVELMLPQFQTANLVDCVISPSVVTTFFVDFGEASQSKGLAFMDFPEFKYLVIKSVDGKGKGQLLPGDRIVSIGGSASASPESLLAAVKSASGKVLVTVQRPAAGARPAADGTSKGGPAHWVFE